MATLTAETIAKLNIDNVLAAYAAEQKAMLAIEAESVVLGVKKADLIKAYNKEAAAVAAAEKAKIQEAKAAEKAAAGPSAWTLALQANTKALADQHGAINKAREATGALGAAISTLSPELGAMVGTLQKLEGAAGAAAGGAEVLGTSLATVGTAMGAVAVAAVPAYLAWEQSTEDLAELDRWVKITTADLDAMEKGVGFIVEAQNELDKRQQKLRGSMTEAEAATYAEADAQKVYQGELAATSDALDHASERLAEMKRRAYDKSFFEFLGDSFNPFSQGVDEATRAIKQQEKEVERLKGNIKGLKGDRETYAGALAKVTIEEEKAGAAHAASSKSIRAEKEEIEGLAALLADTEARTKAAAESDKRRQASAAAHWKAERDGIEAAKKADQEYLAAKEQIALAIAHMDNEEAARKKDLAISTTNATLDAASSLTSSLSDYYDQDIASKQAAADAGNKVAQRAILKDFEAKQKADIAAALINAGLAAINVAATVPAPAIPFAEAAVAAIAATSIAKIANTAPPTFNDTPGPVVAPVQNYQPTFKKNDIIIAAQDPSEAQRQAASLGGGSRWGSPSAARRLAQMNTGWMINDQLRLVTRG